MTTTMTLIAPEEPTNGNAPVRPPVVGSEGWARIIHLASALGRPIGTLNSWSSQREKALPKIKHEDGSSLACVATAKYLHETRPAPGPQEIVKRGGRDYKTISALCSEVACEHGTALAEARKRMANGAKDTDFPPSFRINDHVFCSVSGFRRWAAKHGYTPITLDTLPTVYYLDDVEPIGPDDVIEVPSVQAARDPEPGTAEFVRGLVDDLLEIAHQLETRFVPRGPQE